MPDSCSMDCIKLRLTGSSVSLQQGEHELGLSGDRTRTK
ncbi:hypothetical protein BH18ACI5_BH18ACI5_12050 [soil metagenome]